MILQTMNKISIMKMNSKQKLTYCLGGRHYSNTMVNIEYEKLNPKQANSLNLSKVVVVFAVDELKVSLKISKGTEKAWNKILKPALNATASFIGMAVSAETKTPQVGQIF